MVWMVALRCTQAPRGDTCWRQGETSDVATLLNASLTLPKAAARISLPAKIPQAAMRAALLGGRLDAPHRSGHEGHAASFTLV